ncbi:MAG TPA: YtxH domain-containing protein [Terriglobales bacterium]
MRSFLAGLGIGIGIGLIFAPMSGEETRGQLTRHAGNLRESARDLLGQGRERVRDTVSAIRGKAEERFHRSGEATGTSGRSR